MQLVRGLTRRFAEVTGEFRVKPKNFFELLSHNRKLTPAQSRWNQVLKRAETKLTDEPTVDLQENFLYGFKKEDFEGRNPLLRQALSISNASEGQLMKFKKEASIRKFQPDFLDTGCPQVQVVCMTERIVQVVSHCVRNNKDQKAKRKLGELMVRRNKMLHILKKTAPNHYIWVVRDFNIQQSQKKVESYKVLDRIYKKPVTNPKKFRNLFYNNVGLRPIDVRKESYRQLKERQRHD